MDSDELMKAFSEFLDKRSIKRPLTDLIRYNEDQSIVYTTKHLYDLSVQVSFEIYGKRDPIGAQFLRIIWIYSTLRKGCYGGYAGIRKSIIDNRFKYRNSRKKSETIFRWSEYLEKGIIGYIKYVFPDKEGNHGKVNQFCLSGSTYDRFYRLTEEERRCSYDEIVWSQFGDKTLTLNSPVEFNEGSDFVEEVHKSPQPVENTEMSDMLAVWDNDSSERFLLMKGIEERLTHWTVTHDKFIVPFLRLHKVKLLSDLYNGNFQQLAMDAVILSNIVFAHRDEIMTRTIRVTKHLLIDKFNLNKESFDRLAELPSLSGMGFKLVCIEGFDKYHQIIRTKDKSVFDYQHKLLSSEYKNHPDLPAICSIIEIYPRLIKGGQVNTKMGWLINNGVIDKKYNGTQYDNSLQKLAIDLGLNLNLNLRDIDIVATVEVPKEQATEEDTMSKGSDKDEHARIAKEHGWEVYEQLTDRDTQKNREGIEDDGYYNSMGEHE